MKKGLRYIKLDKTNPKFKGKFRIAAETCGKEGLVFINNGTYRGTGDIEIRDDTTVTINEIEAVRL